MGGEGGLERLGPADEHSRVPEITFLQVLPRLPLVRLFNKRPRLRIHVAETRRRILRFDADCDNRILFLRLRDRRRYNLAELLRLRHHLIGREKAQDRVMRAFRAITNLTLTGTQRRDSHTERHRRARIATHRFADNVRLRDFRKFLARRRDKRPRCDDKDILGLHQPFQSTHALPDQTLTPEDTEELFRILRCGERPKPFAGSTGQDDGFEVSHKRDEGWGMRDETWRNAPWTSRHPR